jgi:CubicO group peptidase (beta-lactamase class C family)
MSKQTVVGRAAFTRASAGWLGVGACVVAVACGPDSGSYKPPPFCGNGSCDWGENVLTCPADCGTCGNGVCDPGEDVASCSYDCSVCGDGTCGGPETPASCPDDCGTCGNGACEQTEDAHTCAADCARYQPLIDAVVAEIDHWHAQQRNVRGLAVGVVEGGELSFARGFGTRRPGQDNPVLPTTLFRIGSNTKKLTAVALLQLVDQGLVSLSEPAVSYVPEFHLDLETTGPESILVRHLLTHESGMKDQYVSCMAEPLSDYLTGDYAQHGYLNAPPGAIYNYSNPGFSLTGLVVERASEQPYDGYMAEHIFAPLGMTRTFLDPADVIADADFAWPEYDVPDFSCYLADNGGNPYGATLYSSVADQARFMRFLRDGNSDVLSDALRVQMQTPQVSTREVLDLESYAYGLGVSQGFFLGDAFTVFTPGERFYDLRMVWHTGCVISPTYTSGFFFFPDLDFGFMWLASGGGFECGLDFWRSLQVALETLATLPEPVTSPDLTVDSGSFDAYAGEYFDPHGMGTILVTHVGSELRVSLPDLDQAGTSYDSVLAPVTPDNFVLTWNDSPDSVTFLFEGETSAKYLRSRWWVGERVQTVRGPASTSAASSPIVANSRSSAIPRTRPFPGPTEIARRMREAPSEMGPAPSREARGRR